MAGILLFYGFGILLLVQHHYVGSAWCVIAASGPTLVLLQSLNAEKRDAWMRLDQIGLTALISWALAFPAAFVLLRQDDLGRSPRILVFFVAPPLISASCVLLLTRVARRVQTKD